MIHMHEAPSAQALVLEIQGKLEHANYEKLLSRPSDIGYFCPGGREAAARWVREGLW